ncbi:hypothetical protein [Prosthecochloris sp. HL-130-GSB]|jgi:hypothetical protein|uniref:Uncharacterized protein n=1 Tax=Prosthecochloris aestuarii TaxID=1102 RepID=A0A831WPD0_PROAE|nr:hypothetical protein [Prosthecochloris sp. HL-130-GSB]ARM31782.1 hypothetical protein B9H02_11380 [Prosthecochloris sp. HL-130-GSB]HED30997.1 hypothetical protein [Prosthecochloris aestuarii]
MDVLMKLFLLCAVFLSFTGTASAEFKSPLTKGLSLQKTPATTAARKLEAQKLVAAKHIAAHPANVGISNDVSLNFASYQFGDGTSVRLDFRSVRVEYGHGVSNAVSSFSDMNHPRPFEIELAFNAGMNPQRLFIVSLGGMFHENSMVSYTVSSLPGNTTLCNNCPAVLSDNNRMAHLVVDPAGNTGKLRITIRIESLATVSSLDIAAVEL